MVRFGLAPPSRAVRSPAARRRVLIIAVVVGLGVAATASGSLVERPGAGPSGSHPAATTGPDDAKPPPPTRQDLDAIAAALRSGDPTRIAAAVADVDPAVLQAGTTAALADLASVAFDAGTLRRAPDGAAATVRVTVTFANGETRVADALLLYRNGVWQIHSTYATGGA